MIKVDEAVEEREGKKPSTELEKLVKEKVQLATKLGLMGKGKRKDGYEETTEYKRIVEIDMRLWELVK